VVAITEANGIFEGSTNISGSLTLSSDTFSLSLNGSYVDGSPLIISGQGLTVTLGFDQEWRDNRSKSTVYFTHNETCKATIAINGIVLSNLNGHYAQRGLCAPEYAAFLTIPVDVDNKQSEVFCHTIRLLGLDGNYFTFEDCNTASFVLDKNTTYTYTVAWENGETASGEFTSPDGGGRLPICIQNSGVECDGGGLNGADGSPRFNLVWSGSTDLDLYVTDPSGYTISYTSISSPSGGILDVDCTGNCPGGNSENITWEQGGPLGVYQFHVNYYSGSSDTPFVLTVRDNLSTVNVINSSLSSGDCMTWSYSKN